MIFIITIIILCSSMLLKLVINRTLIHSTTYPFPRTQFKWDENPDQILEAAKILLKHLDSSVNEWIDVCRQSRHPGFLWEIDYIKPSKALLEMNRLIIESEKILFEHDNDINLKPNFSTEESNLVLFNTARAYIKADNDIRKSMEIWNNLYNNPIDGLVSVRKSNLLCHLHTAFLCTGDFEKSYSCYLKHMTLLKITTYQEQHDYGLWDNMSIMHTLQSFFCKYVPEYLSFLAKKIKVTERILLSHKKNTILKLMPIQMIVQSCSKPFYDHAKSIMPELPSYDELSFIKSTPRTQKTTYTLYEKKYMELLNDKHASQTEIKSMAWSIWHEANNKPIQKDEQKQIEEDEKLKHEPIFDFLRNSVKIEYHSVIDIGCGISDHMYNFFDDKDLTGVDISPYVIDYWKEKGRSVINSSAETFFQECDRKFDLCFSGFSLSSISSIDMFLIECSKKCKHLCANISLKTGVFPGPNGIMQMSNVIMNEEEWIIQISKYFEVISIGQGSSSVFIFATSKQYVI